MDFNSFLSGNHFVILLVLLVDFLLCCKAFLLFHSVCNKWIMCSLNVTCTMVVYCIINIITIMIFLDQFSQFFNLFEEVVGFACCWCCCFIHLQHIAAVQGCILFPVYIIYNIFAIPFYLIFCLSTLFLQPGRSMSQWGIQHKGPFFTSKLK